MPSPTLKASDVKRMTAARNASEKASNAAAAASAKADALAKELLAAGHSPGSIAEHIGMTAQRVGRLR